MGCLDGIAAQGSQRAVVNHQCNFVDPYTGMITNYAETMWQRFELKLKLMFSPANRDMIQNYLVQFMWSQRFKELSYFHFWTQVT